VAASVARMTKPGRPLVWRNLGLMSGVLAKKFRRKYSRGSSRVSSVS